MNYKTGLTYTPFRGAIGTSFSGEIMVGHGSGYFSFYPEDFDRMVQPLKIRLTDVLINNKSIDLSQKSDSTYVFNQEDLDALSLQHNETISDSTFR